MEEIPMEWVDKIFNYMEEFYGERWSKINDKTKLYHLSKTVWQHGLQGVTKEEVKNALKLCKRSAISPKAIPPHVIEFFNYAKGHCQPYIDYQPKNEPRKSDSEIAKKSVQYLKSKFGTRFAA